MSCTRRKESPAALYLGGARGSAVEIRLHGQRRALTLPGGRLAFTNAPDVALVSESLLFQSDEPAGITFSILSDDASPAEVYS